MIWEKAFNSFDLRHAIQTDDGGFLAVGSTYSTRYNDIIPIKYNPVSGDTSKYFTTAAPYSNCSGEYGKKHLNLVKVDANGVLEWTFIYGLEPFTTDGTTAFESQSEGYGIAHAPEWNGYRVVGLGRTDGQGHDDIFVLDIDENGMVVCTLAIASATANKSIGGFNVAKDAVNTASGSRWIIAGKDWLGDASNQRAVAVYLDDACPPNEIWRQDDFQDGLTGLQLTQTCWDANIMASGEIVVPVIEGCNFCTSIAANEGTLKVYALDPSDGSVQTSKTIDLGDVMAFDLQAGITPTSDGGYAVVSSSRSYSGTPNLSNFASLPTGCTAQDVDPGYWDTDAYVSKVNSAFDVEWFLKFDSDFNRPSQPWPGNLKKQECLYGITQSADGGLVISGNTSHNFDDACLVKLYNDCGLRQTYTLQASKADNYIDINGNVTWNSDQKVLGTVVVKNGAQLTVDNTTIEFADSKSHFGIRSGLVVEKGGLLIVKNNSVLTALSGCSGYMWTGTEILGDYNLSQTPSNQGFFTLQNSKIEHAWIAVNVSGVVHSQYPDVPDNIDHSQNGGYFFGLGSTFLNNRRGVVFSPYADGSFNGNLSSIRNCVFETTGPIRYPYFYSATGDREGLNDFISLYGVRRVKILGNQFINSGTFNAKMRGTAINAANASFTVNLWCPDASCTTPVYSEFEGLDYGINAEGAMVGGTVIVKNTTFTTNRRSVRLRCIDFPVFLNNTFNIRDSEFEASYGLHTECSGGMNIEGNSFDAQAQNAGYGSVIHDAGEISSFVYNNTFDDFQLVGTQSQGANGHKDSDGLRVKCNIYDGNYTDVVVLGTVPHQGACGEPEDNKPAGNEFSHLNNHSESDFLYRWPTYPSQPSPLYILEYHHHNSPAECEPVYDTYSVWPFPCSYGKTTSDCQPVTEDCSIPCAGSGVAAAALRLAGKTSLLDGGNTQHLVTLVQTNDPDAYDTLMLYSPYLTDEVLLEVINEIFGHFSENEVFDILAANSSITEPVQTAWEQGGPAQALLDSLDSLQTGTSPRMELEQLIAVLESERQQLLNYLIALYLEDTTDTYGYDSVIPLLEAEESNWYQCRLSAAYNAAGLFTDALDHIGDHDPTGLDTFCLIQKRYAEARLDSLEHYEVLEDTSLYNLVTEIAEQRGTAGYCLAASLFRETFGESLAEEIYEIQPSGQPRIFQEEENPGVEEHITFEAFPNPFNKEISFIFHDPKPGTELLLWNARGRIVFKGNVSGLKSFTLQTADLAPGLYLAGLVYQGRIQVSSKLILSR